MKRVVIFSSILVIAIILFFVFFNLFDKLFDDSAVSDDKHNDVETVSEATTPSKDENRESKQEKANKLNPFGDDKEIADLTNEDYANYIHGMSHQKVRATDKWVNYEMTDERIAWLLEGLEKSEVSDADAYRLILNKWIKGDFTHADLDHNTVWWILDGSIGEATGLLTKTEEEKFIEENYRK